MISSIWVCPAICINKAEAARGEEGGGEEEGEEEYCDFKNTQKAFDNLILVLGFTCRYQFIVVPCPDKNVITD